MKVLGLTGGIASGKSAVLSMFRELGATVVDADQLAREVVKPGQPALDEIVEAFGAEMLKPDGTLDRKRLAARVFTDASARQRLNAITHPRIRQLMQAQVDERRNEKGLLVLDIPLLLETPRPSVVEWVAVVWVDPLTQLARLMDRDHLSEADARARIGAQMLLDEKRRLADIVIDNSGPLSRTRERVEAIYRQLSS